MKWALFEIESRGYVSRANKDKKPILLKGNETLQEAL